MATESRPALNKAGLVAAMRRAQSQLTEQDVELAVDGILARLCRALVGGERVEIRGFGSLALRYRRARAGRNPRVGELIQVPEKYTPRFKAGEKLRARLNRGSEAPRPR